MNVMIEKFRECYGSLVRTMPPEGAVCLAQVWAISWIHCMMGQDIKDERFVECFIEQMKLMGVKELPENWK